MRSRYAFHQPLEEFGDERLQFGDLAHLQHLEQFVEEHYLLGRVGEGPVTQETLDQVGGQRGILRQEQHRASEELFVVELARLDLVQGNDDRLEEDDVLFTEGYGESRDDTGQDVEEFGSTIEFVGLVDEGVEAIVDGLCVCLIKSIPS